MIGRFTARRIQAPDLPEPEEPSASALEGVSWTVFPESPAAEQAQPAQQTESALLSDKLLDAKVRLHRRLIEEINLSALEKLPADRYATAAEFSEALANPALTAARTQASAPAMKIESRWRRIAMGTAAEIYCLKIHASRALYAPTWDRTAIPLPFATVHVEIDGPIRAPAAGATRSEVEETRVEVERRLHALHARAFARWSREPIPRLTPLGGEAAAEV